MGRGGDELSASEVSNEMMDLFLNFFVCLFLLLSPKNNLKRLSTVMAHSRPTAPEGNEKPQS